MGKGDRSTRMEKRKGEGRAMRKSFLLLTHLADVGWRARCSESCTAGSGKGGGKRLREDNALAAYFTPRVFDACFAKKLFARLDKDGVGFWHGQVCSSARLSNGPSASM